MEKRSNIFNKVYIALLLPSIYHSASWNIFMSLYHMPHKHYTNKYILQQHNARKKEQSCVERKEESVRARDIHNLRPSGEKTTEALFVSK
jgi:hypothetical protein